MINHLKALKKSGVNVHALEQCQSRSGHAAKRDFVKDLSLDFNASFCKAVQKTDGVQVEEVWPDEWLFVSVGSREGSRFGLQ